MDNEVNASAVQAPSRSDSKVFFRKPIIFLVIVIFALFFLIIITYAFNKSFRQFIYQSEVEGVIFAKIEINVDFKSVPVISLDELKNFECRGKTKILNIKISEKSFEKNKQTCLEKSLDKREIKESYLSITGINGEVFKETNLKNLSQEYLKKIYINSAWNVYPETVGIPISNKEVVTTKDFGGGCCVLLPENYVEPRKNIEIQISRLSGKKVSFKLFEDILAFSSIEMLPDFNRGSIWVVLTSSGGCGDEKVKKEQDMCDLILGEFNLKSKKLSLMYSLPYLESRRVKPMFIDDVGNVYLKFDYKTIISNDDVITKHEIHVFNPNTKEIKKLPVNGKILFQMETSRYYESKRNWDYDSDGNIYLVLSNPKTYDSEIVKISSDGKQTVLEGFDFKKYPDWGIELAVDRKYNILYAVNLTWDGNQESVLNVYDLLSDTLIESSQITNGSDVRGVFVKDGIYMAAFSSRLGLYSYKEKAWKFILKKNGLFQDQVRDIKSAGDSLCLTHEKKGLSCTNVNMSAYYDLVDAEKISSDKLIPTPTPTISELISQ